MSAQRILVALDGSERAAIVLRSAVHLAQLMNAQLVLYRAIVRPMDLPRDVLAVKDSTLEDLLERNAREDLARQAATLPPGLVSEVATDFSAPWDGICSAARVYGVEMIVIGSHGYSGFDRVLGTTAAKVVNHADRNVLVVRTLV